MRTHVVAYRKVSRVPPSRARNDPAEAAGVRGGEGAGVREAHDIPLWRCWWRAGRGSHHRTHEIGGAVDVHRYVPQLATGRGVHAQVGARWRHRHPLKVTITRPLMMVIAAVLSELDDAVGNRPKRGYGVHERGVRAVGHRTGTPARRCLGRPWRLNPSGLRVAPAGTGAERSRCGWAR